MSPPTVGLSLPTAYQESPPFTIPVLCETAGVLWRLPQRIWGCAPHALEKGEVECLEECRQKAAVHVGKECRWRSCHVRQHSKPECLMPEKQGFPAVEGGDRDFRMFANGLDACPA